MRFLLLSIFLLASLPSIAQKSTHLELDADEISRIILASDEVYLINIEAAPGNQIIINTHSEGEYFDDISLLSKINSGTLYLNSSFSDKLQSGYDKLSAHKVLSLEIEMKVPEGMKLEILSNVASVYISGKYKSARIELKTGSCFLKNYEGAAVINTFSGNILGSVVSMKAEAHSRHGLVEVSRAPGIHKMVFTSINGDIKVSETK